MKKILIAGNALLLGVIILMGCHQLKGERSATIADDVPSGSCVKCQDYPDDALSGVINSDVVRRLSRAYANDNAKAFISGTGEPDALSLVFDLEKMKKFIWLMENSTCKVGCDKPLGIRFYYIKYDTLAIPVGQRGRVFAQNANKHSLAMVPVYKDADGEWYDFDYRRVQKGCNFDAGDIRVNKAGLALLSIDADNHGGVGPPPKPGYYPTIRTDH